MSVLYTSLAGCDFAAKLTCSPIVMLEHLFLKEHDSLYYFLLLLLLLS